MDSIPPVALGLSVAMGNPWLLGASLLAYASQYAGMAIFHRLFRFKPLLLLFFPLISIPLACCLGRALYHRWVHGAVWWRGRSLPLE